MPSLIKRTIDGIRNLDSVLLVLALFCLLPMGGLTTALVIQRRASATQGVLGCAALLVATVLLWLTAERWSRWLTAVALMGALQFLPAIISGTYWTGSRAHDPASRMLFVGAAASFILLALLSMRFGRRRPKTDEKVVLVFFVLLCAVALPFPRQHVAAWTVGLGALSLSWLRATFSSISRRRSPRRPSLSIAP